jgi:hypothetical protein
LNFEVGSAVVISAIQPLQRYISNGYFLLIGLPLTNQTKNRKETKMNKAILKKIWLPAILCFTMISFLLPFPMTCYGDETEPPCPISIDVSPYQVNIDSGGADHNVRVLTYTWYSNTDGAFVYINDNKEPIDPEYIVLTRDSVGHLVVKIDLVALQDADLEVDTYHDIKIVVELKETTDDGCVEKEGTGKIYIIGKKGDLDSDD